MLPVRDFGDGTTRRHVTVAVVVYRLYDDGLDVSPEKVPLETQQSRVRHADQLFISSEDAFSVIIYILDTQIYIYVLMNKYFHFYSRDLTKTKLETSETPNIGAWNQYG